MKNITLTLLLLSSMAFGQKLTKNEVDEFTGASIKETSWISLQRQSLGYSYTRLRKVDSTYYLNFKVITQKVTSIEEGASLMLKLKNDSIIELSNLEHTISSRGGGSTGLIYSNVEGVSLKFKVSKEQLKQLYLYNVVKTRVYTTDGYIENEVKENLYEKFKKQIRLILN